MGEQVIIEENLSITDYIIGKIVWIVMDIDFWKMGQTRETIQDSKTIQMIKDQIEEETYRKKRDDDLLEKNKITDLTLFI